MMERLLNEARKIRKHETSEAKVLLLKVKNMFYLKVTKQKIDIYDTSGIRALLTNACEICAKPSCVIAQVC
jgi:hypothetical protein